MRFVLATIVGLVVLGFGLIAPADEEKVPLQDVPKAVLDAVKAKFPHAELKGAEKGTEDDETVYEISLVNAGKNITVSLEEDGEITEIETELAARDLPQAVLKAVETKYPKAVIQKAEESIAFEDGQEEEKLYELEIATLDGTTIALNVEADGEIEEAEEQEDEWTRDFATEKRADLVSTGRNPFFVLEPGFQIVLEGGKERVTITVLEETKTVDGVETRVIEERETKGGKPVEVSRNYFAISKRTNSVYYFGEDVDEYENGKVTGHGGSWLAGVDGARFGLMMPGLPLLGAKYYQEVAPGKALDRAEIVGLHEVLETPAGKLEGCLKTDETTALEPNTTEVKHYAPGIGQVQDGDMKLVRYGPIDKK